MSQENVKNEFLELLTPNHYKIHGYVFSLMVNKSDADDVLQATLACLWENFDKYKRGTNFVAWAFSVAKYQVMTYRKKQKRSIVYFCDETIDLIDSENLKLVDDIDERLEYLSMCMRKLPRQDMLVIDKRFNKDISISDIAKEYCATANAIYKRMAKIKKTLLKCINRALANGDSV